MMNDRLARRLLHLCSACLLAAVCASGVEAQTRRVQKSCPIPPPSPYKHTALISTRYDSRAELMRTVLEHPVALGESSKPLYFTASFAYGGSGDAHIAPRTRLDLALVAVGDSARYAEGYALRVFADGHEQTPLAPTRYAATTVDDAEESSSNRRVEQLKVSLPAASLLELAGARAVQLELGGERYSLTENHLEALRELASLMRAPAATSPAAANTTRDAFPLPQGGY